ncbi:MAG TPA: hypothetical protein DIV56_02805 [Lachnospiraceae bacterium]|nr:hypothetical protein [Lachnospiraceae bacterium]
MVFSSSSVRWRPVMEISTFSFMTILVSVFGLPLLYGKIHGMSSAVRKGMFDPVMELLQADHREKTSPKMYSVIPSNNQRSLSVIQSQAAECISRASYSSCERES